MSSPDFNPSPSTCYSAIVNRPAALIDKVEFGFAYEKGMSNIKGLLDDRFTFDFVFHF